MSRSASALSSDALEPQEIRRIVHMTLDEDLGQGDLTSQATISSEARLKAEMAARQDIVVAGLDLAREAFLTLAPDADFIAHAPDGMRVGAGVPIASVEGPAQALLSAERTALNLLQTLSGIATLTRTYADEIAGTGAVLLDTRKTIPGLRLACKYATRMGGGQNHRLRLDDGVLIKDNHIASAGSVTAAVKAARTAGLKDIEVECDTLSQAEEAIAAGADRLLLDNMAPADLKAAVSRCRSLAPGLALEASGGVTLKTIRAIAETGVDFISTSRITQAAPAVDIGLDWSEG